MPTRTFHIVWTTYGTWLPGDQRGWVHKGTRGVQPPDEEREAAARRRLAQQPVQLTDPQRRIVEQTIRTHCRVRGWSPYAVNVRSNHVHVVLRTDREAWDVMKQLKSWCSRRLSDAERLDDVVARRAGRRRWFTEGGKCKTIENEQYLENAVQYVLHGQ